MSPSRREKSRAALLQAAQSYLAEGNTAIAVFDIAKRAGVGTGTFYNHFETKEELFDAAVDAALEAHADVLDQVVPDGDPARAFADRFRLTGRLHRLEPALSKVVLSRGVALLSSEIGFGPRARRDIALAIEAGRFKVDDLDLAMALAFGAAMSLGQLLHDDPSRSAESTTDDATESLLRMLGMTPAQARRLAHEALPDLPVPPTITT
ncbi:MAG: TetR/AcrR family transcriptional regulator [Marmoricola sp.]